MEIINHQFCCILFIEYSLSEVQGICEHVETKSFILPKERDDKIRWVYFGADELRSEES